MADEPNVAERDHAQPAVIHGSPGASLPPAPAEAKEAIAAAVGRLRAEIDATADKSRRARLLHEAGEIQERGGDEPGAARDYLAAYNADTSFREPLEGLVRVLERRRSLANLGKLIEALVAAASTPEERTRALTQRAIFFEDVQKDLEGARGAAREATETGAVRADLGPAWLTLELAAAKLGDVAHREEALAGRAETTLAPTWRGLLWIDAAKLAAQIGDVERALSLLDRARGEDGGQAAWAAACAVERIVHAEPGLPGSDDARARKRAEAEALEARADMLRAALSDPARGEARGVPLWCRAVEHVVDLLLRAADARRSGGELVRAAQDLDRALEVLAEDRPRRDDEPTAGGSAGEKAAAIERIVLTARLRLAELVGDTALAAELAQKRMIGETDGGVVASLAMRVAEHAASEGDVPRALEALTKATHRDPASAPGRALAIDILEAGPDAPKFAAELEELSRQFTTSDAQGRALLLAAYVWATRTGDRARARAALDQAAACGGVPKETVARFARGLAAVCADDAWYEDATRSLLEVVASPGATGLDAPLLWIEIARMRLAQHDEAGAARAIAALRELDGGAWIGCVLDGLASSDVEPERARSAIEQLAKSSADPSLSKSLAVMSALRAHAAGDVAGAIAHLEVLCAEDAHDPLVAAYLGDLLRLEGNRAAATRLSRAVADAAMDDPDRAGARLLEAGFETWRGGDRQTALAAFAAAGAVAPDAARAASAWATRGVDVDSIEGRRRALDAARADAGVALERFALEAQGGDLDDAANALADVEITSSPSLRLAGALARIVWTAGAAEPDLVSAAVDALAATSDAGKRAAAAERLRIARESAAPADEIAAAAKAWLDVGGGAPAALEWIAAAMASGAPEAEIPARRALAEILVDEAREAMHASATLLEHVLRPDEAHALVAGSSHASRLANLELAPPGCDPRRRASALSELDGALGEDAEIDALALAAWSALAAGDPEAALTVFRAVTAQRADDLHAWEGMRTAAEQLGDHEAYALACEQLGLRSSSDARGAAFWEQAALAWLEIEAEERAEAALDASFARDPARPVAFDKLFRRVRERKDHDKLLSIIERRLSVSQDAAEMGKLHWERARVLREKGDPDGALEALEEVRSFDADHVGALALTGEIFIRKGMFEEAAESLARLARVEAAPAKNRITAGIAAVDLYENKLSRHDLALGVLVALHEARLSTMPVRERLARAAARTGAWTEATRILEELMNERQEREGRIEAARLAMAIHRERMLSPVNALPAATKLLSEAPTDGDALDFIVSLDPANPQRRPLLERGRDALVMALHEIPGDVAMHRRLARVSHALGDGTLEQAALSCALALGGPDGATEQMIAVLVSRKPRVPAMPIADATLRSVLAPGDDGPIADLFAALGPTLAEALGPTRDQLGVGRKDRIDAKTGLALRQEIAQWANAFGIKEFELYVGGKDAQGVIGIPGKTPALVVGAQVSAPLSPAARGRLARELLGIRRGTTVARWRDDTTIAAIVVAACNLVKVRIEAPPMAVLAEVERTIAKAIPGKVKSAIEPICRQYVQSAVDPRQWAARARASQARMAAVAAGDASVVLADVFGEPIERLGAVARDDLRAHDLLRFVLSRPYFDVRRTLGLEG